MDKASTERLKKVHPDLAIKVGNMIEALKKKGLDVRVVQGLRTIAEQDALYAKGRTAKGSIVTKAKGGESNHNYGLAVDLCPFTAAGAADWNNNSAFASIGAEAKAQGLEWGGDWKFVDKPHVQIAGLSIKDCKSLYSKGGLGAVWKKAAPLSSSPSDHVWVQGQITY